MSVIMTTANEDAKEEAKRRIVTSFTVNEKEFMRTIINKDEDVALKKISEIRAKAYKQHPYPCIMLYSFVRLHMSRHPVYKDILEQAMETLSTNKPKLLDIGCCMGTELRKALLDGYPSDAASPNLYGMDLLKEFIDYGFELFQDGPETNKPVPISFFAGDVFDKKSPLEDLTGQFNYIFISAVFHLFDEATQRALAERLLNILDIPNLESNDARAINREFIIFGMHQGKEKEEMIEDRFSQNRYGHSPASWIRMWEDVLVKRFGAERMSSHVQLDARLGKSITFHGSVYLEMVWSVRIVI